MPDPADLFPGFIAVSQATAAGRIFALTGGRGPPLVLLHGFPESLAMWHAIAPGLADQFTIVVMDAPTASTLSQILPLLLLTLVLELRRTALHRRFSRVVFGVFFFAFGVIETVLVLSIDGMLYPFQWGDLLSALAIFTLLTMIFVISFLEPGTQRPDDPAPADDDDL